MNEFEFNRMLDDAVDARANVAPPEGMPRRIKERGFAMGVGMSSNVLTFGTLDGVGGRGMSRGSLTAAAALNIAALLLLMVQVRRIREEQPHMREVSLLAPVQPPAPLPAIEPRRVPLPAKPVAPMPAEPRIVHPPLDLAVPAPAPMVTAAQPVPSLAAPAPRVAVTARAAAPVPIVLGQPANLIAASNARAASPVNLGVHGVSAGQVRGSGTPLPTAVGLGSGSGSAFLGRGNRAVASVSLGTGISSGSASGGGVSALKREVPLPRPVPAQAVVAGANTMLAAPPEVVYKPEPAYPPDARKAGLQATVGVRIKVSAAGEVTVLGVVAPAGHGFDESAMDAARRIQFRPAHDDRGRPVDWEGVVRIQFQIS